MGKYVNGLNVYRGIVIAFLGAVLASGSWGMSKVVEMPSTYILKTDLDGVTSTINKIDTKVGNLIEIISCLPEKYAYKEDVQRKDDELGNKVDRLEDMIHDLLMLQLGEKSQKEILDKHNNK